MGMTAMLWAGEIGCLHGAVSIIKMADVLEVDEVSGFSKAHVVWMCTKDVMTVNLTCPGRMTVQAADIPPTRWAAPRRDGSGTERQNPSQV